VKAIALLSCIIAIPAIGWTQSHSLQGRIVDSKNHMPLSRATIRVNALAIEVTSGSDGRFELRVPSTSEDDSLRVSHIGFKTFIGKIEDLPRPLIIPLEDYSLELKTVTITSKNLKLKEIDQSLRRIKGNLYAYETELTNGIYNLFLTYLEEDGLVELRKLCGYDLSSYDEAGREFYSVYTAPYKKPLDKTDTLTKDYTDFPAVNISHEAATLFCQWFTEQYNNNKGKKKFSKVRFRLPSLSEWQIAALGYPQFQSWNLTENKVAVVIPSDTISETRKGEKTIIPVNNDILYPWWMAYNYRKKPQNQKNCFLGNFKVPYTATPCERQLPGYDGWVKMSLTATYFPNGVGLYDVVGNVAEMINEEGKACGGSWNDPPKASTIHSVKLYRQPDDTIGFRVFLEVLEE
jgi:formylglycine-generating enzyme required for sulfatase activity